MYYPDYLVHFNKNHSPKNGQFTSGDGDGDGISNDHAHRSKKSGKVIAVWEKDKDTLKKTRQKIIKEQKEKRKKMNKGQKIALGLGIATGLATAATVGIELVMDYRNEKLTQEINDQMARDFVEKQNQIKWREAASKAKFVGGDW